MKLRVPTAGSAFCWTITLSLVVALTATIGGGMAQRADQTHWLNTTSDVRHNSDCHWFEQTKTGQPCKADEGLACGLCGG